MSLLDEIQQHVKQLPPEKQSEVLDFIAFLQQRSASDQPVNRSLTQRASRLWFVARA